MAAAPGLGEVTMNNTLPIAPNGIFRTIQGEGSLIGTPMIFVRLAGCSIGCPLCDTDYSVSERLTDEEICKRINALKIGTRRNWVWVTGGEPTDHEWLYGLTEMLKSRGFNVAIASAGHRTMPERWERTGPTYLSISPHDPAKWVQDHGNELKIVPGLNGFRLKDFDLDKRPLYFGTKFVQPCDGMPETVDECREFVETHPGWLMTVQAHKQWGMA